MEKNKMELAISLGRSMAELRTFMRQYIQEKIKEAKIDITFEMLEVMSLLWKEDGINQQEIADHILKDKSSMTYLIDNLVKRELVLRTEDEKDRRNRLILLTNEGRELKNTLQPWLEEVYSIATADLDAVDLKRAVLTLEKMIDSLR
ncbi:putative MarR-family transcriptional regulator [Pedobacter sp. BAL39]|uniref:MarR family winged helix-turn-helix transcriptional regulator n=1 Tax=Pedobacter sp. BAL39 TaxID=391596 RepID=UPI00015594EB|nr:MarR family transcriptional regulator [Pedobacter sp. BAL39]EDM37528.1 putative MarR-family transcriptional regulator [Pedobacter sp. BAL39]